MRQLDDALFRMTDPKRVADGARSALMALGGFVYWLTSNAKARESLNPPPLLSAGWTHAADDGSPEFRVAAALAGLGLPTPSTERAAPAAEGNGATGETRQEPEMSKASPMTGHFAPISEDDFFTGEHLSRYRSWSKSTTAPNVVWGGGGLVANMIAVLERRLAEAAMRSLDDKPLAGGAFARLDDVGAFLSTDFDDARCAALLGGLIWARPVHSRTRREGGLFVSIPFAYAALKPVFVPDRILRGIGALPETSRLPVPAGLVSRLRVGGPGRDGYATDTAVRAALARARGSGVPSPFDPARAGGRPGATTGGRLGVGVPANRLAAALLIPIDKRAITTLMDRAYPGSIPEPDAESTEDMTNAA